MLWNAIQTFLSMWVPLTLLSAAVLWVIWERCPLMEEEDDVGFVTEARSEARDRRCGHHRCRGRNSESRYRGTQAREGLEVRTARTRKGTSE